MVFAWKLPLILTRRTVNDLIPVKHLCLQSQQPLSRKDLSTGVPFLRRIAFPPSIHRPTNQLKQRSRYFLKSWRMLSTERLEAHKRFVERHRDDLMVAHAANYSTVAKPKLLLPPVEGVDFKVPVPWGYIAAKEYGNRNGLPVLAVHGWLDNLGSFVPLIPYILSANNLHIVSFDEPGCGLSSKKPIGSEYGRWSTVKEMKRIIDFMGWSKVTLIGHSQGGHFAFLFSAIFPNIVERMVSIDMSKPLTFIGEPYARRVAMVIESHLAFEEKCMKDPTLESFTPVYSESDALKRMLESHGNSLGEESARILMERGTVNFKGGLAFSRDVRLKLTSIDPTPSNETMLKFMARLSCDILIIKSRQGPYLVSESLMDQYRTVFKSRCPIYREVTLDGSHHLHMNDPDIVAPIVNEFFSDSFKRKLPQPRL